MSERILEKAQIERLKQLGTGLYVEAVLGDRVLVETVAPETGMDKAKKSGLYIPESIEKANTPKPATGIILLVGDDVDSRRLGPGVMVLFSKYAGFDFIIDEHEGYRVLDTREILCVLGRREDSDALIVPEGKDA